MSFEALLNDLEELKKAQAPVADEGDNKIKAAAAEAGNGVDDDEEGDGDDGSGDLTKSFTAIIDGEEQEVIDGAELVKSLQSRVEAIGAERVIENEHLSKSLTLVADMLKGQGEVIKSLQAQVENLSNEGRGRKSVTQPTVEMTKSLEAPVQLNASTLMAKANAAFDSGRISGKDLTVVDVALRYGTEIDQSIMSKIMAG